MEKKQKTIILVLILVALCAVLCFVFMPKKYNVSFNTDGGNNIKSIEVSKNKKIVLPKNPTKDGYIFDYWELDGKKLDKDYKVTKNIELKAIWKDAYVHQEITITFDSKGGTNVDSITITKGDALHLPENPTRDGYTFITWKDGNEVPIGEGALLDSDIKLYAYWEEVKKTTQVNKSNDAKKVYYCQDGYTLKGTKCYKLSKTKPIINVECPEGSVEQNDNCFYTKQTVDRINTCKKNNGDEGVYLPAASGCLYDQKYKPRGGNFSEDECKSIKGYYYNGKCYSELVQHGNKDGEPKSGCPSGYGLYNPPHNNTICAKLAIPSRDYECEDGYSFNRREHICEKELVVNAKLK